MALIKILEMHILHGIITLFIVETKLEQFLLCHNVNKRQSQGTHDPWIDALIFIDLTLVLQAD